MLKAMFIVELVLAILLVVAVLLQHRGTGLGGAFASEANVYRSKRGVEKFLYRATIALGVILVAVVLADLFLRLRLPA
jgi:preprotein translocase subunit SecG